MNFYGETWAWRLLKVARACVLAGLAVPFYVQAEDASGLSFAHQDWMLVCDNTRTCRAVGYQRYADSAAVSVLLTRKAGPNEPVRGKVKIGEVDLEEEVLNALASQATLSLVIDGHEIGEVEVDPEFLGADLPDELLVPLLRALRRDSEIEWVHDEYRWRLSDAGATAVLLKMDDVQGRVGTPGAMVRKGERPEADVLPALAPPVVVAVPVDALQPLSLPSEDERYLRAALRASVADEIECEGLAMPEAGGEELDAVRLDDSRLLVAATCWMAAYNAGAGFWVVSDSRPYRPVLVTDSATDFDGGTISAIHKGRGLGDCYSIDEWTWDGQQFVQTLSSSTGQCRNLAAGGAWQLPERVTEVRQAAGSGQEAR